MKVEVLTKEDLQAFRVELVQELKTLLTSAAMAPPGAPWLKGKEVRKLLKISANTLQNLRVSGRLHPSKLGGIYYYQYEEIYQVLKGAPQKPPA